MPAPGGKGPRGFPELRYGTFYVQIGSFSEKQNAFKLQKRFTSAGHTTVIQEYCGTGDTFYRVQVYAGRDLD